MKENMTPAEAVVALKALDDELTKIKEKQTQASLNLFLMAGLTKQETKHSYFLSELFNPNGAHGFGVRMIQKFCSRLWNYQHKLPCTKDNVSILKKTFDSKQSLVDAFQNISVEREVFYKHNNGNGFCDILIADSQSKSILIIENKTLSSTHDNQLLRYQEFVDKKYEEYQKRVFVYLTPKSEQPINIGGDEQYNDNWCVFDYIQIVEIISELKTEILLSDKNKKRKLQTILEDYIEMLNAELLYKDQNVIEACKEILHKHKDALDIINDYVDNTEEMMQFCRSYMTGKGFIDLKPKSRANSNFYFISPYMITKLAENSIDNTIRDGFRFCYRITKENEKGFERLVFIKKNPEEPWQDWQLKLKTVPDFTAYGQRESSAYRITIIYPSEIHSDFSDMMKEELTKRLDKFIEQIKDFESKVKDIF